MKKTIISKLKRVALTLFAALCVGNLWGAYCMLEVHNERIEDGKLKFTVNAQYLDSDSTRKAYMSATLYNADDEIVIGSTRILSNKELKKTDDRMTYIDLAVNNVQEVTGCSSIDEFYDRGYWLHFTFEATKKNTYTSIDCWGYGKKIISKDSGITECEVSYDSTVQNGVVVPLQYRVFGKYNQDMGVTSVVVSYKINEGSQNEKVASLNTEDGSFECEIPCQSFNDTLTYSIKTYIGSDVADYRDLESGSKIKTSTMDDEGYVTYTWLGDVNDKWGVVGNWGYTGPSRFGYPGEKTGAYHISAARFSTNAEVDLNGGRYTLRDENRGLFLDSGITVKLSNGTILFGPGEKSSSPLRLGAANSTLILQNVAMPYRSDDSSTGYDVKINANSTVVLEGDQTHNWTFRPDKDISGTTFKVKNGVVRTKFNPNDGQDDVGANSRVEIENGVWVVNTAIWRGNMSCSEGIAKTTVFRDGPDSQARLMVRNEFDGTSYYNLKLIGTYDIKLPETPYPNPYVLASLLIANTTCTMKIDASDYKGDALVPLIQFKGTLNNNTRNAMNTMTNDTSKLFVTVNGVEGDAKGVRNAKLVWNASQKILYYQQDAQKEASIGTTAYATLSEALEDATDGATITILNNIATDAAFQITKKVTIDLNGKTIATTQADTEGNGVFWVQGGGELTLEDSSEAKTGTVDGNGGSAYKMAIWADGGQVVINGGNYVNENDGTDNQYDLIYVKNGGEVVINGGTFKCQTPRWTLNSNNTNTGRFVVTGGKFYQYNPTDFDTDEPTATTWCAENTAVIETTENEVKVYTVVPAAAKISNVGYATFDAALEAAASGDTVKLLADVVVEKVVVVPNGATLDLNGKSIQALAVIGKLAMNGGALKTYDTNTQTYFFMAAPAGTAALYWTSDAVMTIGADYALSLDGGSVTLPSSWRSLLKQTLTIKSGATFVIPQGVELNLRGNAVVEKGATLTCEGTIALGNTYDAVDTSATLTSAQLAEGKVVSAVEGYKVQYADGKYTLVKEGYTLTITDPSVTVQTQDAANAVQLNVVPPKGLTEAQKEAYLGYFEKKITANAEGGYTVELALKDELKPVIAETTTDGTVTPAITFEDGKVTVNIENKLPGLNYGVRYATTVEAVEAAKIVPGLTVTPAAGDTAGFFKVVVDFKPIPEAE